MQELCLNIHENTYSVTIDPKTDNEIKTNLLQLLEKKKVSLQIAAACHEYITNRYSLISKGLDYSIIALLGLSFILSTVLGGQCSSTVNIPWAITTGLALIPKGIKQMYDYTGKATAHDINRKAALDLSDDIEYIILKNNHTKYSLQQSVEVYEERIKGFRKSEEPIPLNVKLQAKPHLTL